MHKHIKLPFRSQIINFLNKIFKKLEFIHYKNASNEGIKLLGTSYFLANCIIIFRNTVLSASFVICLLEQTFKSSNSWERYNDCPRLPNMLSNIVWVC